MTVWFSCKQPNAPAAIDSFRAQVYLVQRTLPACPAGRLDADIAQLVEQRIRNAKVVGSTLLSAPSLLQIPFAYLFAG